MQKLEDMSVSDLILKVKEGGGDEFSELIRRYLPMIKKVSSSFISSKIRDDEAFCEASVAFYKAAMTYDAERTDVTFGLYARICVYRRLCDLAGKENRIKEEFFSDLKIDSVSVQSGIESALVMRESMRRALAVAKSLLSEYEYEVFILGLEGYASAAIADKLGSNAKSVDNAKARAVKRLREKSALFSEIL